MDVIGMNVTNQNISCDQILCTKEMKLHFAIASVVGLGICTVGFVGNAIVFWYLCFKIQRNIYTVYIMNLSLADALSSMAYAVLFMIYINLFIGTHPRFQGLTLFYTIIDIICDLLQFSDMYILTALSMEKCISVLFPLWYRSRRPQNLSTKMCILIWIIGCVESLLRNGLCLSEGVQCTAAEIMVFVLAVAICLPLMVTSSFILLIKIKWTFRQQYAPTLYINIIVTVFWFIISVIPFNCFTIFKHFKVLPTVVYSHALLFTSIYCVILNCSINPFIYFLVGSKWKQKSCLSIKDSLQRAFRDEKEESDDLTVETDVTDVT